MVWDLPTRLFHWGFVISITGAYISGERGAVNAHELFGLAACGLLPFVSSGGLSATTRRALPIFCTGQKSFWPI